LLYTGLKGVKKRYHCTDWLAVHKERHKRSITFITAHSISALGFYPCVTMIAWFMLCPSVCHKSGVLSWRMSGLRWFSTQQLHWLIPLCVQREFEYLQK